MTPEMSPTLQGLLRIPDAQSAIRRLRIRMENADEAVNRALRDALSSRFQHEGSTIEELEADLEAQEDLKQLRSELRQRYVSTIEARIHALYALQDASSDEYDPVGASRAHR